MNMNEDQNLLPPESFDFPFPPYQIQHEFMKKLYEIIETKSLGIFESPTGTGKSLSIICGAIKWLKDHNTRERQVLSCDILELEKRKQVLDGDDDWLNSQSKGIEIGRKLSELKLRQNKINEYDTKINNLCDESKRRNVKKHRKNKFKSSKINDELGTEPKQAASSETDNQDRVLDEEELLIEEPNKDSEDGNGSSDEENKENKYEPTKIFICSRTHSQLSQFVGEIIKSPFGEKVRVTTLGSRQNYCINQSVTKLKSMALINERCLDMQKNQKKCTKRDEDGKVTKRKKSSGGKCEFFNQSNIENLRDLSLAEVMDIEDLVGTAKELKACPYYASRKAAEDAEIVLVPYHTILHKATREANGIKLKNNVIIIDEAHNLLEAMVQMYGAEISYFQLFYCEKQLKAYRSKYNTRFSSVSLLRINQILFVVKHLKKMLERNETKENKSEIYTISNFLLEAGIDNYNMFQLVRFCKDSKLAQKLHGFMIKNPEANVMEHETPKKGVKQFLASIENKKQQANKQEPIKTIEKDHPIPSNPLLAIISFFEALTYSYDSGRIITHSPRDKKDKKIQFMVLNPTEHFKEIVKEARSVIVAGGTMKPIEEFRNRLFKNAGADASRIIEFSCDHIVAAENILPVILTKGSKNEPLRFNYENRFSMAGNLKEILLQACKEVSGGIVVFFPSYKYESWVWQQLKDVHFGTTIFREPQQSSGVDAVLENYAKTIQKTKRALLFSVVGGKLSEGLNFSDDLGRCVIVVGMPYANIYAVDLKEKMAYLEKLEGYGAGKRFYESMCMKAVNQCIGRAVRHKNDYATVILVDERYDRPMTKNDLPGWIKRSLITCDFKECFEKIEQFFQEKKQ